MPFQIQLSNPPYRLTQISDEDIKTVLEFSEKLGCSWRYNNGYAVTSKRRLGGRKFYAMHNIIMKPEEGFIVDHINRDRLDNRRENLRIVSFSENCQNRSMNSDNTSGIRGVHWNKAKKIWKAHIYKNYKMYHLGSFECKLKATTAYNEKSKELFGIYGFQNDLTKVNCQCSSCV